MSSPSTSNSTPSPAPAADTSVDSDADSSLHVNQLLQYSQHPIAGHFSPILWDLREPPLVSARRSVRLEEPISARYLNRLATDPPAVLLRISCELLKDWPIDIKRLEGVTVGDVLQGIHRCVMTRITLDEWNALHPRQQERVEKTFLARCNMAPDKEACRAEGVLRVDCLLNHTMFAGMSVSPDIDCGCVLTLRRSQ